MAVLLLRVTSKVPAGRRGICGATCGPIVIRAGVFGQELFEVVIGFGHQWLRGRTWCLRQWGGRWSRFLLELQLVIFVPQIRLLFVMSGFALQHRSVISSGAATACSATCRVGCHGAYHQHE